MAEAVGESRLATPLLEWLKQIGRIRGDSIILRELPWFGRRVDLVTLTCSGRATAYELKINNNRRAIQQAAYNRLAFDRSYVVTATNPTERNLKHANEVGVGLIFIRNASPKFLQESENAAICNTLRKRLLSAIALKRNGDV